MDLAEKIERNKVLQYIIGISSITILSLVCSLFADVIGYHVIALILLLAVTVLAMFLETLPIVVAAVLSALIWNFLFIQPRWTFNINTPEDALLFLMYFLIAVLNGVFTSRIRKIEDIARKRKEKEKTLQLYNALLNSLSHELKTPISAIIGSVDTLKMGSEGLSDESKQELYNEIDIGANRLHQQVNNLLNMSRLESNFFRLQLDWYDINEILHRVVRNNTYTGSNHTIILQEVDDLPLFKVDGPLVEQMVHNIVHNALQYTPSGTSVCIKALLDESNLKIIISDNGNGFPEDKLDLVFEKFYRLPNSAAGGTGLGLSIARGFAKAHNGNITLKNLTSGGAEFTIVLPAEKTSLNTSNNE